VNARAAIAMALFMALGTLAGAEERRSLIPFVWNDVTGARDMPWLGAGGRAKWFVRDTTTPLDAMDPRGPKIETRWGASGGAGESPYATGNRAADYLERIGALKEWPAYPKVDQRPPMRAFPYRITIVCIEPTVAIMRFDLAAAIEDPIEFSFGAFPPGQRNNSHEQRVAGGTITNSIMFATRIASGGSLLWFSPDVPVPPTPIDLAGGRARIMAKGITFELEQRGAEIVVSRR